MPDDPLFVTHVPPRCLSSTQVTKHDDVFMLDGEGMPTIANPFVKGRLFIIFKVRKKSERKEPVAYSPLSA